MWFEVVKKVLNIPGHHAKLAGQDLREGGRYNLLPFNAGCGGKGYFVIAVCVFQRTGDVGQGVTGVHNKGQGALVQMGFITSVIQEDFKAILLALIQPVYTVLGKDKSQFAIFIDRRYRKGSARDGNQHAFQGFVIHFGFIVVLRRIERYWRWQTVA